MVDNQPCIFYNSIEQNDLSIPSFAGKVDIMYYLGIDLGGTNIAVGIVNEKYEIIMKGI